MVEVADLFDAIEAEPTGDLAWLALADWFEEGGHREAGGIRWAMQTRKWQRALAVLLHKLHPRTYRKLACDSAERNLPAFERLFPDEPAPRRLVRLSRRNPDGKQFRIAHSQVMNLYQRIHDQTPDNALTNPTAWSLFYARVALRLVLRLGCNDPPVWWDSSLALVADDPDKIMHPNRFDFGQCRSGFDRSARWHIARLLRLKLGVPVPGLEGA